MILAPYFGHAQQGTTLNEYAELIENRSGDYVIWKVDPSKSGLDGCLIYGLRSRCVVLIEDDAANQEVMRLMIQNGAKVISEWPG